MRTLLTELAAQAGVPEPEILARQLHLLYDDSGQSARTGLSRTRPPGRASGEPNAEGGFQ